MSDRPYPIVTVNEKAARALRAGHPWVYGAETAGPDGPYENGDLVDVVTAKDTVKVSVLEDCTIDLAEVFDY